RRIAGVCGSFSSRRRNRVRFSYPESKDRQSPLYLRSGPRYGGAMIGLLTGLLLVTAQSGMLFGQSYAIEGRVLSKSTFYTGRYEGKIVTFVAISVKP